VLRPGKRLTYGSTDRGHIPYHQSQDNGKGKGMGKRKRYLKWFSNVIMSSDRDSCAVVAAADYVFGVMHPTFQKDCLIELSEMRNDRQLSEFRTQ
jgi:hypothetical protein